MEPIQDIPLHDLTVQESSRVTKPKRWILVVMAIIAFLGLMDASYLTAKHYMGEVPSCTILHGCEQVTTSAYATIGPIPVALLGAIFYLTMLALVVAQFLVEHRLMTWSIKILGVMGFLVSIVLVSIMVFVIRALCIYCLGSALSSTLLFIFSALIPRPARSKATVI